MTDRYTVPRYLTKPDANTYYERRRAIEQFLQLRARLNTLEGEMDEDRRNDGYDGEERACPVCGDDHIWQRHPTCYPRYLESRLHTLEGALKDIASGGWPGFADDDSDGPAAFARRALEGSEE